MVTVEPQSLQSVVYRRIGLLNLGAHFLRVEFDEGLPEWLLPRRVFEFVTSDRKPNYSADGGVLRLVTVHVERGNGSVYRGFWTIHEVPCFSQRME
jgi:hypothetical protein